jgi:hypothetical protein
MYIESVSELAFDDITPDDPDFASIQGENTCRIPPSSVLSILWFFIICYWFGYCRLGRSWTYRKQAFKRGYAFFFR